MPRRLPRSARREAERAAQQGAARGARGARRAWQRIVDIIADIFRGPAEDDAPPDEQVIEEAIDILEEAGYTVGRGTVEPPPVQRPPEPPPVQVPRVPAAQPREGQAAEQWPEETTIDTRRRASYDPRHATREGIGEWIETPQSSNVHSFAYDKSRGVLYVRYKAPSNRTPRPHVAGALYSYGGAMRPVPEGVYRRLKMTTSKGRFVWDYLRIRGTLWGHQYPYTLVEPSPTSHYAPGQPYVPRKATRRGFRVRQVPTVAQGSRKRQIIRSFLPPTA